MKYDDIALINETIRNAHMAVEAIDTVMPKVYDEKLGYNLQHQKEQFEEFEAKGKDPLERNGITPQNQSKLEKAMLWSGIQMNTALNINTKHMADIMIQGNTKGITQLTKAKKENDHATNSNVELAEELIGFEQSIIENLKDFL